MFAMKRLINAPALVSVFSRKHRRDEPVSGPASTDKRHKRDALAQPLVLIADDSSDDRWMMKRCFVRAGFRVAEVASGEDVVFACSQQQPQAVVVDLLMPHTGGLTACQLLREQPGGKELTIIVVSGLGDPGTRHRALASGANDFIPKPAVGESLQGYGFLVQHVSKLLRQRGLVEDGEGSCQTG